MTADLVRRSWWEDDPDRLDRERVAMAAAAPELVWLDDEPSGGWEGPVPLWPFERSVPEGVQKLTSGTPLVVRIVCGHAYPMVEPAVYPLGIDPPYVAFGWSAWHLLPNGGLCLLRDAVMWNPEETASALIPKVSGWHLEYLLMLNKRIDAMTESGLAVDESIDSLFDIASDDA